ncbi:MAG: hypothetical protein M3548_23795 [Actinomycetota bacterium]|nr:hypothetical protein [Actinomycetota bacterium]
MKLVQGRTSFHGAAVVVAATIAMGLVAYPAQAEVSAERSADVNMYNRTGCTFVDPKEKIDEGQWTESAPAEIQSGDSGYMRTESDDDNGGGVKASVTYTAEDCDAESSALEGKSLRFSWHVRASGNNAYTSSGTASEFYTHHRHHGSREHPQVDAYFMVRD